MKCIIAIAGKPVGSFVTAIILTERYHACAQAEGLTAGAFSTYFDSNNDELRWRSRVKLAYDIPKCKIEPYASVEMYNGLNRGEKFDVQRMRYRGGVVLPLSSDWEADVFYCRQWESQARKDIVGVACTYSF